jgi:hypothetical protein|tara:strand:- start:154 stop:618 length:465 start_codon:yes stop_codon:yes gene_type:complete
MKQKLYTNVLLLAFIFVNPLGYSDQYHDADGLNESASENAKVFIVEPTDNQIFTIEQAKKINVVFGSKNILIKPAGELVPNSGHHHLLINVDLLPDLSMPIPASDQFIHFGKGQESTVINLPKGRHKLQLILGNHVHIPHKPPVMSDPIYVEVK